VSRKGAKDLNQQVGDPKVIRIEGRDYRPFFIESRGRWWCIKRAVVDICILAYSLSPISNCDRDL
jgi:hypothetical protein